MIKKILFILYFAAREKKSKRKVSKFQFFWLMIEKKRKRTEREKLPQLN